MKKLGFILTIIGLMVGMLVPVTSAAGAVPVIQNYGNITLTSSGSTDSGNFPEVWDLTGSDMVIQFTYDGTGLDDASGAHAWSAFGIRQMGYGNFNPTWHVEGAGVWLATDYDGTANTFDPDLVGSPSLDMDDKLILQKAGGNGEGDYNLPGTPPSPGNNHRVWFDRDGVDQWQGDSPLAVDGGTYNTNGLYNIVLTLHANTNTDGTAYMTVNGLNQGFETDGNWNTMELTPAGMTFTGDMTRMQVYYGLYGYGATHTAAFNNISVTGSTVIPVDVYVTDSNSNPISGTEVFYKLGSTYVFGTTDGTGHVGKNFPVGTTNLEVWAKYNNTTSAHVIQDISINPVFNFQTIKLSLRLETGTDATPLNGGKPRYGIGATYTTWWFPGGTTGSSAPGETAAEVFPGTYSFEMQYATTAEAKISVAVPDADTTITWQTTNLSFNYSGGSISYGGTAGDSTWFTKPSMELLAGTYKFHFRDVGKADVTIAGCNQVLNVAVLSLKDHNGDPLAGGPARGGYGTSYSTWHVPGSTDANGILIELRDGSSTSTMSYEMKYNNTTEAMTQDVAIDSFFDFQTNFLTLRLETCADGTPLDGGKPRYGSGATYTTWWFPGGVTGSSAAGETSAEFFPGTYSFEMQYQATATAKISVDIPDADTTLIWQTTKVTLNYSDQISYGGTEGDSTWFTKPSMELLQGNYRFHFRGDGYADLAIDGCSLEKTIAVIRVLNPDDTGIAGASAQWWDEGGLPSPVPGSTDETGTLLNMMDGNHSDVSIEAMYNGYTTDPVRQNPTVNSFYVFHIQFVNITIASSPESGTGFINVDGNPISTPQTFSWAVGSTHTIEAVSCVAGPPGTNYHWTSWSDGGSQIHSYVVPGTDETITANYSIVTLKPVKYQLISYFYLNGRTFLQQTLKVRIANQGVLDVKNVSADISYKPAYVTIIDGHVTLGNINSSSLVWSIDPYTIKVKLVPLPNPYDTITWRITYIYLGSVYTLENVPQ